VINIIDDFQNDKLADLENRLRIIETAVIELGIMSKFVKYGVLLFAASLGLDLTAVM
jgi:hypothetical protein